MKLTIKNNTASKVSLPAPLSTLGPSSTIVEDIPQDFYEIVRPILEVFEGRGLISIFQQNDTARVFSLSGPNGSEDDFIFDTVTGTITYNGQPLANSVDGVQALIDLKAISPLSRADRQLVLVEDEGSLYRFDAQSSDIPDGIIVVAPDTGSGRWYKILTSDGTNFSLSPLNKDMQALVTGADNSLACATALFSTPPSNAWLQVYINGISYKIGNGSKVSVPCYFSSDGGVTAKATGTLATGDLLYWNGSVANFQLDSNDRVDFIFESL